MLIKETMFFCPKFINVVLYNFRAAVDRSSIEKILSKAISKFGKNA